ncbi:response regulator [Oscillatoria sp. FACHB-1407]|uniref:response regulator n=1 Tax=Oscillatoria sp. FACHB-1407 TaxID=2692847 RepID=UPI001683AA61|nr:response regulator [Oscillatoria sp. FACHB-1407]MBD2460214.1 response regulator [Oscillatoria sp. FACHB-1407]
MTVLDKLSLLIVDDDFDSRFLLTYILEQEGANVTSVASATEALEILERQQPDVLLSDIAMPETDGYRLMHQIKSNGLDRGGALTAIAITAMVDEESGQRAMLAGYQFFLAKPIDQQALVGAIAHLATQRQRLS